MHNRLRMIAASFPDQGPAGIDWRWGERLFRRAADRLRPRGQQRRLAVGGVERLRRAALLPHLQPSQPEREVRRRGPVHPALPAAAGRAARQGNSRAVAGAAHGAAGSRRRTRPRLPATHRDARRGAGPDAAALQRRQGQCSVVMTTCCGPAAPRALPASRASHACRALACNARSAPAGLLRRRACRGSGPRRVRPRTRGAFARCAR